MGAAGVALSGLLHATAAGALVLAGLSLALPEVVDAGNPLDAVAQAATFGLASLRISLESGGVEGTFVPLSGLVLTLWGLVSAARKAVARWPGVRVQHVAATGLAFSLACLGAAAAAGAVTTPDASLPEAALAGLVWGSLAGAVATHPGSGSVRSREHAMAPALLTGGVALAVAAVWWALAAVAALWGSSARGIGGGLLLAVAFLPNAAATLVAVGLGGWVSFVLDGTVLADPLSDSISLWDGASFYVAVLVLAPLTATLAGGRLAAARTPEATALIRGLRNGAVLGAVIVLAGWAGSLGATAADGGDRVSVRLGFGGPITFAAALAWGVAGGYLGPRLPLPGRSRVNGP